MNTEKKNYSKVAVHTTYTATAGATAVVPAAVSGVQQITGLPSVISPMMRVTSVSEILGTTETAQVINITIAAAITADTTYALGIKGKDEQLLKHTAEMQRIATRTGVVLSGSAVTDRHNVYHSLAYKINALRRFEKQCKAYALFTVLTSAGTGTYNVGDIISANSGANKAIVMASATGATPTLSLATIPGYGTAFTGAITSTSTSGGTGAGTASTITLGVGLRIIDNGSYYPVNGYNGGETIITALETIATTDIVISTAAVYAKFTGAQLLAMKPVSEYISGNLSAGHADMTNLNSDPVSGTLYNLVVICVEEKGSHTGISDASGQIGAQSRDFAMYLSTGGNYAATLTALQGLVA